jgi:hypothetical protein
MRRDTGSDSADFGHKIWVLEARNRSARRPGGAFTGDETQFVVKGSIDRADRVPMSVLST